MSDASQQRIIGHTKFHRDGTYEFVEPAPVSDQQAEIERFRSMAKAEFDRAEEYFAAATYEDEHGGPRWWKDRAENAEAEIERLRAVIKGNNQ